MTVVAATTVHGSSPEELEARAREVGARFLGCDPAEVVIESDWRATPHTTLQHDSTVVTLWEASIDVWRSPDAGRTYSVGDVVRVVGYPGSRWVVDVIEPEGPTLVAEGSDRHAPTLATTWAQVSPA